MSSQPPPFHIRPSNLRGARSGAPPPSTTTPTNPENLLRNPPPRISPGRSAPARSPTSGTSSPSHEVYQMLWSEPNRSNPESPTSPPASQEASMVHKNLWGKEGPSSAPAASYTQRKHPDGFPQLTMPRAGVTSAPRSQTSGGSAKSFPFPEQNQHRLRVPHSGRSSEFGSPTSQSPHRQRVSPRSSPSVSPRRSPLWTAEVSPMSSDPPSPASPAVSSGTVMNLPVDPEELTKALETVAEARAWFRAYKKLKDEGNDPLRAAIEQKIEEMDLHQLEGFLKNLKELQTSKATEERENRQATGKDAGTPGGSRTESTKTVTVTVDITTLGQLLEILQKSTSFSADNVHLSKRFLQRLDKQCEENKWENVSRQAREKVREEIDRERKGDRVKHLDRYGDGRTGQVPLQEYRELKPKRSLWKLK